MSFKTTSDYNLTRVVFNFPPSYQQAVFLIINHIFPFPKAHSTVKNFPDNKREKKLLPHYAS